MSTDRGSRREGLGCVRARPTAINGDPRRERKGDAMWAGAPFDGMRQGRDVWFHVRESCWARVTVLELGYTRLGLLRGCADLQRRSSGSHRKDSRTEEEEARPMGDSHGNVG